MLNFVLCDDSQNAINQLSKMLDSIMIQNNIEAQVVFATNTPSKLLTYVKEHQVDVVILDIDLKDKISGLEAANIIRKNNKNTYIIFITGHLEYSLMAYKYKTFDYIAKPVTKERLEDTITRLYDDATTSHTKYIRLDNNKTIIPEDSVKFIQKDGMKSVFYTDNREYETYNSFNKITTVLPDQFVRCHKSYIVNLNRITYVDTSTNMIKFDNNETCYIGPKYKNNFMEVFNNGIFTNDSNGNYNTK